MSKVLTGTDALDALNEGTEETSNNEFTYLKSGTTFYVKVPGINMISRYVYGSFAKNIYSFVAEEESKKSDRGFPTDNLTPFDKAYLHHKDQSLDWQDEQAGEANNYRATRKFTLGFYNLDTGEPIMVEFTRNQANTIVETIKKYENRLDQFAFELSKQGKQRDTTVSLSLIPILEDLTETQQKHFAELPNEFDAKNFEGLHYVMSTDEQIEKLIEVGFDVSLIGLDAPKKDAQEGANVFANNGEPIDVNDSDLPF